MKTNSVLFFGLVYLFTACSANTKKQQQFKVVPMSEKNSTLTHLEDNTQLQILAFGGGNEKRDGKLHFYQFLTVTDSGDTILVLSPAISIAPGCGQVQDTHMTPLMFDFKKGVTRASFLNADSTNRKIFKLLSLTAADLRNTDKLKDDQLPEQVFIANTSIPFFAHPQYPTAAGILRFSELPY